MNSENINTPLEEDPRPPELVTPDSLLIVNTGHGKGKSTAAFGMMIRGVARDWKVGVVQFVKSGDWNVGEEKIGRQLGVDWTTLGEGFSWDSKNLVQDQETGALAWAKAQQLLMSGTYDLLIFDELTYPLNWKWIEMQPVLDALVTRPRNVHVVVTGRDAPQALIDIADTVSEIKNIKHAYQKGFKAKRGIDF
jgi:cob(I)alamin adenosyltransferase